jgi:hypothetical protein
MLTATQVSLTVLEMCALVSLVGFTGCQGLRASASMAQPKMG